MRYLIIFLLSLFITSNSYAKVTILECKYVGGFVDVKGKKEYTTREEFNKSGLNLNMDKVLKIDTRKEEIFRLEYTKFISVKDFTNDFYKKWDDTQIFWSYYSQRLYDTNTLNRLTGKLVESTYQKSDLKKQLREGVYNCQEAKKKF